MTAGQSAFPEDEIDKKHPLYFLSTSFLYEIIETFSKYTYYQSVDDK